MMMQLLFLGTIFMLCKGGLDHGGVYRNAVAYYLFLLLS